MSAAGRLAAILAADVVGYSRLMGEDETGTAKAVRERREASTPIVAGRGGRIVETMGDGLLLEFRSVVAAVECAVAILADRSSATPTGFEWGLRTRPDEEQNAALHRLRKTKTS
jgi:class 3 adenylate cyclase